MSKINVLIFEDSKEDGKLLSEILSVNDFNVVAVAEDYAEALNHLYTNKIDIVIIDIFIDNQPEGINLAQSLNADPKLAKPFVFLTNSSDRKTFEKAKLTKPFSYLLKPFNELEIIYSIEVAIERFYGSDNVLNTGLAPIMSEDFIFFKIGKSLKKVWIDDMIYIEVENRYCNVVTDSGKYLIQISLSKFLPFLEVNGFIRTHRNYVANPRKIIEIIPSENSILLIGNHSITYSNKYRDILSHYRIF